MIGEYRFKKFYNRRFATRFVINSLPKAGTNLLGKAVGLFTGVQRQKAANLYYDVMRAHHTTDVSVPGTVPVGVGSPLRVPLTVIEDVLHLLQPGCYGLWHVPFSDELSDVLVHMQIKMAVMMRDPRDVVISQANYARTQSKHRLYAFYQSLSETECILKSITGVEPTSEHDGLVDIDQRCRSIIDWKTCPNALLTSFEKLVGPQGGGTQDDQLDELRQIANHLGFWRSKGEISQVAERLFGGTNTFRKGQIGGWRDQFSKEHKRVFKSVTGSLLIDLGYEQDENW